MTDKYLSPLPKNVDNTTKKDIFMSDKLKLMIHDKIGL